MGVEIKTGFWYDGGAEARKCVKWGLGNCLIGLSSPEDAAYCREKGFYFFVTDLRDHATYKIPGAYLSKDARHFPINFGDGATESAVESWISDPRAQMKRIKEAGGRYFLGTSTMHEFGGRIYWPKEYLIPATPSDERGMEGDYLLLPQKKDLLEAKETYVSELRKVVEMESEIGAHPLILICSSALHKYHFEAGVDIAGLEVFPGDVYRMYGAIRGASKAYGKKWAACVSMVHQGGGACIDEIWFNRYKIALLYSYLSGADFVMTQHGAFNLWIRKTRKTYGVNSSKVKKFRQIFMDFHNFCQTHPRPDNGPKVSLGIVHGNLDGNAGLWTRWVWGQYGGEEWKHSAPEFGWDYLPMLYRRADWYHRTLEGDVDYTGNPPYGQYDLVPIEAPEEVLSKYSCLVFLGWNTMTPEIYEKLKKYVADGGHLVMAVPHLSTQTRRGEDLQLYNGGDYTDLFGVVIKGKGMTVTVGHRFIADSSLPSYQFPNWGVSDPFFINGEYPLADVELKGAKVLCTSSTNYTRTDKEKRAPVLIENSFGRGKAFLITSWCYPGERAMAPLMKEILMVISNGEQGHIRLSGSDRIRYAVYEEGDLTTLYLLNTDFEVANVTNVWLGKTELCSVSIESAEMRIAYLYKNNYCFIPKSRSVHIEQISREGEKYKLVVVGQGEQEIEVACTGSMFNKASCDGRPLKLLPGKREGVASMILRLKTGRNVIYLWAANAK